MSAISQEEFEKLSGEGSVARVVGRSKGDNPFYRSESCPAATGEPIDLWQAKLSAWEYGWTVEDAMRSRVIID